MLVGFGRMFVLVCVGLNLCWYVLVGKDLNFGVILSLIRDFSNGTSLFNLIYDLYTNLLHCCEVLVPCVHSPLKVNNHSHSQMQS